MNPCWLIPTFLAGVFIGIALIALISANRLDG